jgi:hypothetical protein
MGEGRLFQSAVDGAAYYFDAVLNTYIRITKTTESVGKDDLPIDVKNQIKRVRDEAEKVLRMPV